MVKIIKYNDSKFNSTLEKIIQSKRVGSEEVKLSVSRILQDIKKNKDKALFKYAKKFDNISIPEKQLKVKNTEIRNAKLLCSKESLKALKIAAKRIEKFHSNQIPKNINYSDKDGVKVKTRWIPLDNAGIYVPGGKASYPSSVLMSAIPAKIAESRLSSLHNLGSPPAAHYQALLIDSSPPRAASLPTSSAL